LNHTKGFFAFSTSPAGCTADDVFEAEVVDVVLFAALEVFVLEAGFEPPPQADNEIAVAATNISDNALFFIVNISSFFNKPCLNNGLIIYNDEYIKLKEVNI